MPAPARPPTGLGNDLARGGDGEGILGAGRERSGEERSWRRARINIGGDSRLAPSVLFLEAEAEKAVTGYLGHQRFASFSLVTGLTPKAKATGAWTGASFCSRERVAGSDRRVRLVQAPHMRPCSVIPSTHGLDGIKKNS